MSLGLIWVNGMLPFPAVLHQEYSCKINEEKLALGYSPFLVSVTVSEVRSPAHIYHSWGVSQRRQGKLTIDYSADPCGSASKRGSAIDNWGQTIREGAEVLALEAHLVKVWQSELGETDKTFPGRERYLRRNSSPTFIMKGVCLSPVFLLFLYGPDLQPASFFGGALVLIRKTNLQKTTKRLQSNLHLNR